METKTNGGKPKLHWATKEGEYKPGGPNLYGYYNHNRELMRASELFFDITPESNDALSIVSAEVFKPVEGKRNWLFTMWEGLNVPDFYMRRIQLADIVLVPSTWVMKNFLDCAVDKPLYVIPHGVSEDFTYKERQLPKKGEKFRFLWLGAPNNRKGWEELNFLWGRAGFDKSDSVELYMKTAGLRKVDSFLVAGNTIVDNRHLSREELVEIYHSAHCFVFPTRGEGFGLTLAEAMRTGLPCIATNFSGLTDFFDEEVGYPVSYFEADAEFSFRQRAGGVKRAWSKVGMPEVGELVRAMLYVPTHYDEALERGRRAYERIAGEYFWEASARALLGAFKDQMGGEKKNVTSYT